MCGSGRRVLGPDRVDEGALGDHAPTGERETYHQPLEAGPWKRQATVTTRCLERAAEQRDAKPRVPIHGLIFARAQPESQICAQSPCRPGRHELEVEVEVEVASVRTALT